MTSLEVLNDSQHQDFQLGFHKEIEQCKVRTFSVSNGEPLQTMVQEMARRKEYYETNDGQSKRTSRAN